MTDERPVEGTVVRRIKLNEEAFHFLTANRDDIPWIGEGDLLNAARDLYHREHAGEPALEPDQAFLNLVQDERFLLFPAGTVILRERFQQELHFTHTCMEQDPGDWPTERLLQQVFGPRIRRMLPHIREAFEEKLASDERFRYTGWEWMAARFTPQFPALPAMEAVPPELVGSGEIPILWPGIREETITAEAGVVAASPQSSPGVYLLRYRHWHYGTLPVCVDDRQRRFPQGPVTLSLLLPDRSVPVTVWLDGRLPPSLWGLSPLFQTGRLAPGDLIEIVSLRPGVYRIRKLDEIQVIRREETPPPPEEEVAVLVRDLAAAGLWDVPTGLSLDHLRERIFDVFARWVPRDDLQKALEGDRLLFRDQEGKWNLNREVVRWVERPLPEALAPMGAHPSPSDVRRPTSDVPSAPEPFPAEVQRGPSPSDVRRPTSDVPSAPEPFPAEVQRGPSPSDVRRPTSDVPSAPNTPPPQLPRTDKKDEPAMSIVLQQRQQLLQLVKEVIQAYPGSTEAEVHARVTDLCIERRQPPPSLTAIKHLLYLDPRAATAFSSRRQFFPAGEGRALPVSSAAPVGPEDLQELKDIAVKSEGGEWLEAAVSFLARLRPELAPLIDGFLGLILSDPRRVADDQERRLLVQALESEETPPSLARNVFHAVLSAVSRGQGEIWRQHPLVVEETLNGVPVHGEWAIDANCGAGDFLLGYFARQQEFSRRQFPEMPPLLKGLHGWAGSELAAVAARVNIALSGLAADEGARLQVYPTNFLEVKLPQVYRGMYALVLGSAPAHGTVTFWERCLELAVPGGVVAIHFSGHLQFETSVGELFNAQDEVIIKRIKDLPDKPGIVFIRKAV